MTEATETKVRAPKRTREEIDAELTARLEKSAARKRIEEWAARRVEDVVAQAARDLGADVTDGITALSKALRMAKYG